MPLWLHILIENDWMNHMDIFLKMEALGYYANCDWFHELSHYQLVAFYHRMFQLWAWRLGLSPLEKEALVPGHMGAGAQRLFKHTPEEAVDKPKAWWQRNNLSLMEAFVTRARDAEQQKLGAMYVLMGLVQVSRPAALALPWVVDSVMW